MAEGFRRARGPVDPDLRQEVEMDLLWVMPDLSARSKREPEASSNPPPTPCSCVHPPTVFKRLLTTLLGKLRSGVLLPGLLRVRM